MENTWYTLSEVSKATGKSIKSLRKRVARGTLDGIKGSDGLWRISRESVHRIQAETQNSHSPSRHPAMLNGNAGYRQTIKTEEMRALQRQLHYLVAEKSNLDERITLLKALIAAKQELLNQ